jgi:hypothetical protein
MAHLVGTNITVWFKLILQETFESAKQQNQANMDMYFDRSLLPDESPFMSYSHQRQLLVNGDDNFSSLYYTYYNGTYVFVCKQLSFQVTGILQKLVPFMHPCTIEYSIICVTLLYSIWANIGSRRVTTHRYSLVIVQAQIYYLDCNKTMKGLFSGILIFLLVLIILILYIVSGASFIMNSNRSPNSAPQSREMNKSSSSSSSLLGQTNTTNKNSMYSFKILTIFLTDGLESLVIFIELIATILVFVQINKLNYAKFKHGIRVSLDEVTQIFSLSGVLSFSVFRCLAFRFSTRSDVSSYFLLVNGIMSFAQSLLQTMLILEGLKRKSNARKRGRELITFLIMTNISLWLFYSITRNKYANLLFKDTHIEFTNLSDFDVSEYLDIKKEGSVFTATVFDYYKDYYLGLSDQFYGSGGGGVGRLSFANTNENAQALKWIIINTISYPLLLYFHFHSSCCLSDIWKECYKPDSD